MTAARFGGSAGLLQRLRPTRIDVADLREVADSLLPDLCTADLQVRLVPRARAESLVVVEEHERCTRVPLGELADDMTAAGVRATPDGISAALSSWVAHRPVTDAAAAAAGVAVLDWADAAETGVAWRVVVRRGGLTLPWSPPARMSPTAVLRTRSAATSRSSDVALDLRVEGQVALWSHPVAPMLATTALVAPERMIAQAGSAGLSLDDMHVVVTPHRPVACAGPGIAARLAGETTEASVTLPWRRLPGLRWG
ncbi:MAG: hypothetical protein JWQ99_845 [Blastococcus sp.]|jgi:hypothetical protein|nr:hypothetical protein [Blastococcus sp.]